MKIEKSRNFKVVKRRVLAHSLTLALDSFENSFWCIGSETVYGRRGHEL